MRGLDLLGDLLAAIRALLNPARRRALVRRAQSALRSHAQPGGLWQVSCRWMQLLPHALPLVQVRQQVRGSSAGLAGLAGFAGSGRCSGGCGSLGAGFSGACCAIAPPSGVAASISTTTNNTYLSLLSIPRRYRRRSATGSDFTTGARRLVDVETAGPSAPRLSSAMATLAADPLQQITAPSTCWNRPCLPACSRLLALCLPEPAAGRHPHRRP